MKYKFFNLFSIASVLLLAVSCKKEENRVYVEGSKPVVLAASASTISLNFANAQKEVVKFSWNNPEYKFTTGISSQDVTYKVEIDTTGANFTNPDKKVFSFGKELSFALTDSALNDALLNSMNLQKAVPHNLEVRVVATLLNGTVPIVSNVIKYPGVTPYAIPPKVEIPANGELWAIGDAFASKWDNPMLAPYTTTQKFTQVTPTLYELTVNFVGGGGYKLIQIQGDWDTQYHMITGGTAETGEFKKENADPTFPGQTSGGSYKISVDFQKGKYTVTKL
jgi:hypothetical protein